MMDPIYFPTMPVCPFDVLMSFQCLYVRLPGWLIPGHSNATGINTAARNRSPGCRPQQSSCHPALYTRKGDHPFLGKKSLKIQKKLKNQKFVSYTFFVLYQKILISGFFRIFGPKILKIPEKVKISKICCTHFLFYTKKS